MGEETLGTIVVTAFTIVVFLICAMLWTRSNYAVALIASIVLGGVAVWADYKVIKYFIDKHRSK